MTSRVSLVAGTFAVLASLTLASLAPVGCSAGANRDRHGAGGAGASSGEGGLGIGQGGNTGGSNACASDEFPGELVPMDLHVVLDQSSSMSDSGKWNAVVSALQAFIADTSSIGVGLGLQYFPVAPTTAIPGACTSDMDCGFYGPCLIGFNVCGGSFSPNDSCDPADYTTPEIPIAPLPGIGATVNASLAAHGPTGDSTPSQPAMEGAVNYATGWAQANPTHLTLIVLATDGDPTNCNPNSVNGVATAAQQAAAGSPSVKTFVVGVGSQLTSLNQIAAAGGTGQAFLVDTSANVTQQFIDALNQIRATGQCQFQIPLPTAGMPDFDRVNVTLVDKNDSSNNKQLANVGSEAGCDPVEGGWYYDDPNDPKIILLCQASCDQVLLTDWDTRVELGCKTIVK